MRILYYGPGNGNSGSRLKAMRMLGHEVEHVYDTPASNRAVKLLDSIEWRTKNGPRAWMLNRALLKAARACEPELVWTEMGKLIYADTLRKIKEEFGCTLMNTFTDDPMDPMKRSRHFERAVPLFDHMFVTRKISFEELRALGARRIYMFWKGFNPDLHFPEVLSPSEMRRYGTDVVFIGHAEPSRIPIFNEVASCVESFKIWGNGWQRYRLPDALQRCVQFRGVEGHEYRKALRGAKIALQYTSHWARDTHSSRSFELPGCGVFMLANRTEDHMASFEEGKEAEYYSSTEEMLDKIRFYLAHDALRRRIAEAGYQRSIRSGYSNFERTRRILHTVTGVPQTFPTQPVLASA